MGAAHIRNRIDISNDVCVAIAPNPCPPDFTEKDTGLAAAFGGGFDFRVSNRIDIRLIQIDYNPMKLFDSTQQNIRIGIGIVFTEVQFWYNYRVLETKVFSGESIDDQMVQRIIDFDRQNMQITLDQAGVAFPEENRRKSFQSSPTLIVAFVGDDIAGYVEYLRSWNDPRYIYISSFQIEKAYRRTKLILQLIDKLIDAVSGEDFLGFETNVQKVNKPAIEMYRKIGFQLKENPRNEASWIATAGPELLSQSPIIPVIQKWRSRLNR